MVRGRQKSRGGAWGVGAAPPEAPRRPRPRRQCQHPAKEQAGGRGGAGRGAPRSTPDQHESVRVCGTRCLAGGDCTVVHMNEISRGATRGCKSDIMVKSASRKRKNLYGGLHGWMGVRMCICEWGAVVACPALSSSAPRSTVRSHVWNKHQRLKSVSWPRRVLQNRSAHQKEARGAYRHRANIHSLIVCSLL